MGKDEKKGPKAAETDNSMHKDLHLEPTDSVSRGTEDDVTNDAGEDCEDFIFDTIEMYEFLQTIKRLKTDPQCVHCKATARKLTLDEPKPHFMMCSDCGQCFCTRLANNEEGPMEHARAHAKSACHPVALWIDQPDAAYCFKCDRRLCLKVIASAARAHEPYVVRGIPNQGNTCFVNALVQCLFALGKLRMWMFGPDAPMGSLGVALKNLFVETTAGNDAGATLNPNKLLDCLGALNTKYNDGTQQDIQELLLSLRDGLNEEELLMRHPNMQKDVPTVVDSIFQGQLSDTLTCKCCLEPSSMPLSFYELSLTLPPDGDDSRVSGSADKRKVNSLPSIKECLEYYFRKELVIRNCDSCTKNEETGTSQSKGGGQMVASIKESISVDLDQTEHDHHGKAEEKSDLFSAHDNQNASTLNQVEDTAHEVGEAPNEQKGKHADKELFLSKLPPVLTLHVLRFKGNAKRPGHVKFEENLDVGKFLDPRSDDKDCARYRLVGVIQHIGSSLKAGHYVAFVRGSRTGNEQQQSSGSSTWFRANDWTIREVSLANVLKCEAYLLFYERIED